MKLTHVQIKNAQSEDKPYKLSDGKGLYLLVNPNGSRYWRVKYRFDGKEKLLSLGVYPEVSLLDARKKLDLARKQLEQNLDPSQEKNSQISHMKEKNSNTFQNIAYERITSKKDHWSKSHYVKTIQFLENDVFPIIGKKDIGTIKPIEMLKLLQSIEARGAFEVVKKVRQQCIATFNYAILSGCCEYNPCLGLNDALQKGESNHYPHLLENDLARFLCSIDTYKGSRLIAIATWLLIITGVRPGEIRQAMWHEIDFDKAIWEIPAERMKKRKPHIVPLSSQALRLLEEAFQISGSCEYIFIGQLDYKKPMSDAAINRLIKEIGYKGKVTGHGFRHTMSTILHEHGFNTAHIELQLAHVDKNSIRGTYNHAQYLEDRRAMLQWYADHIDKLEAQAK